ncbi:helix-turn-helix transcriptional regulator [Paraburkholderia nemoris]|uniref:helix-turn-helix transcriptional regulator n=1 Tax=Paraburkholderia nemoris TaxID=2793076 RepID=UPI001B1D6596|nr:AlpA family phage regulatory protein [Paraburkholderia nemoris]CAE6724507.1 hypothetical protein LMG22931_01891 [Paraburkholderia nemoris]
MTKPKTKEAHAMPAEGFIRAAQFAQVLSISTSTLYQWIADDVVPKPVRLGPKALAWNVEVVRAWIDARSSGSAA